MSVNLTQEIQAEVAQASALPLSEQPAAFAAIREKLEVALNSDDSAEPDVAAVESGE